ncbi:MAG: hypothetical protein ACI9UA_004202, partial [Pseudoalteromonas tetraodonis]
ADAVFLARSRLAFDAWRARVLRLTDQWASKQKSSYGC